MPYNHRFAFSPASLFQVILFVIFTLSTHTAYAGLSVSVEPNTRGVLSTLMDCNIVISFGSDVEIDLNKILVKLNGEDVTEDIRSLGTTSLDESKKNLTITYPAHASYFKQSEYTFEVSAGTETSEKAVLNIQNYDSKAICVNCDSATRSISDVALSEIVAEQTRAVKSKDKQKPKVTSFKVKPEKITLGQSLDISYSVTDAGGLKQVELWRSSNNKDWKEKDKKKLSGKKQSSGTFKDKPNAVGNWYYGVHVVDNAGNWDSEGGPKKVTVVEPSKDGWSSKNGYKECTDQQRAIVQRALSFSHGSSSGQSSVGDGHGTDIDGGDGERMLDAIRIYDNWMGLPGRKTTDQPPIEQMKTAFHKAEYARLGKLQYDDVRINKLVERIIEVYKNNKAIPRSKEAVLGYLEIRRQCHEWADYVGGKGKTTTISPKDVRPGMGYFTSKPLHAMIIIDVYRENGKPTKFRVAEANNGPGAGGWINPEGQVPWLRTVRNDRNDVKVNIGTIGSYESNK